jgi:periplasmic divalent cation tolerance protein
MKSQDIVVVLVTAKNRRQGKSIARHLLEKNLAACVNITGAVESMYWWEGKIVDGGEVLLVIKTRKALFRQLEAAVREKHSYTVPEIIALPITDGYAPYLKWINDTAG